MGLEKGRPPPPWFEENVDLLPGEDLYIIAFRELTTERQLGMSMGPIPVSQIKKWAVEYGFDDTMRSVFVRFVRALDIAYMEWVHKQSQPKKATAARGRRR